MGLWSLAAGRRVLAAARAWRNGALTLACTLVLCVSTVPAAQGQAKPAAFGPADWNTFLGMVSGNRSFDSVNGLARVGDNGVVVVGTSYASWDSPVRPFTPNGNPDYQYEDAFVARLDGQGKVVWNTFLGNGFRDEGMAVVVDAEGAAFVAGHSMFGWEQYANDPDRLDDAFVAKLSPQGQLLWLSFLGGSAWEKATDLALDDSGNIYVVGYGYATWGAPKRPYTDDAEAFVAKLTSDGALLWNTFLGSDGGDRATDLALQGKLIYVAGTSSSTLGSPVEPHTAGANSDGFIAQLSSDGDLNWNTFLGTAADDRAASLVLDAGGRPILAGALVEENNHKPICDGLAAKTDTSGKKLWLTRLTGAAVGGLEDLVLDGTGNVLAVGVNVCDIEIANGTVSVGRDGVIVKLDPDGTPLSTQAVGGPEADNLAAVALVDATHLLLGGASAATWGTPVRPFGNDWDGLVAYHTLQQGEPPPALPPAGNLYLPLLSSRR